MSRIRRSLVVAGLAVAVALGAALPAWAAFTDTAAVSTSISTTSVQPPTGVHIAAWCRGRKPYADVTWQRSPSDRGLRYDVTAQVGSTTLTLVADATADGKHSQLQRP